MSTSSWKVTALSAVMRATQTVSTAAAARLADRLFCSPPSSKAPAAMRDLFARAERSTVLVDGQRVVVWRWGSGPTIALVHGWGSRAARLGVHVEPLLARGFSVVAFDAPAHGESEGTLGSGIQSGRALLAVAAQVPLYGVVAHSLGCASTLIALRAGLELRRAVFIAPPSDIEVYLKRFAELLHVRDDVIARMKRRTEERIRFSWADLDLVSMARAVRGTELLLIHDRDDDEVAWHCGESIAGAWTGARFVTTEGLGHHRIARDPDVVAQAAEFIAEGRAAQPVKRSREGEAPAAVPVEATP